MKPVRNAISFVIHRPEEYGDSERVLLVRRPEDDEDLPGVWGLPAGSLLERETFPEAVGRAGREKLGVELEVEEVLNDGQTERDDYLLYMKLFRARIVDGEPEVPQPVEGITQYSSWEWADPKRLRDAADRGSLCSRLLLEHLEEGDGG